ncbi:MAG: SsrA-binding protein SmpB [Treponema sp.]|nr:SsrA-binding protein SmpB [Treponema sp.]MDE6244843.1 SsrA-binding protein SmpB [Treponemataceae bacterium]
MMENRKIIAENRKARFDYFIEDKIECGIVLEGTEVKSVKNGNLSFPDAFAEIINDEVIVRGLHISEYSYSSVFNHNPDRPKKLLLHKDEIKRLKRKIEVKGYTLIPTEIYLKNGLVKITLGVCKGKKQFDKRNTIKERDINRDLQKQFRKGLDGK